MRVVGSARHESCKISAALVAVEKILCFVILSEAKNLSSISVQAKTEGEILRFAQNDNVFGFSAASLAAEPLFLWFSHRL